MAIPYKLKAKDIARQIKTIKDTMARAESVGALNVFKREALGLKFPLQLLTELTEKVEGAQDGYAQNKPKRRAMQQAYTLLYNTTSELEDLITQTQSYTDLSQIDESGFWSRILTIIFDLNNITFSGDVPRARPTREELYAIEAAETSPSEIEAMQMAARAVLEQRRHSNMNTSPTEPSAIERQQIANEMVRKADERLKQSQASPKPGALGDAQLDAIGDLIK